MWATLDLVFLLKRLPSSPAGPRGGTGDGEPKTEGSNEYSSTSETGPRPTTVPPQKNLLKTRLWWERGATRLDSSLETLIERLIGSFGTRRNREPPYPSFRLDKSRGPTRPLCTTQASRHRTARTHMATVSSWDLWYTPFTQESFDRTRVCMVLPNRFHDV